MLHACFTYWSSAQSTSVIVLLNFLTPALTLSLNLLILHINVTWISSCWQVQLSHPCVQHKLIVLSVYLWMTWAWFLQTLSAWCSYSQGWSYKCLQDQHLNWQSSLERENTLYKVGTASFPFLFSSFCVEGSFSFLGYCRHSSLLSKPLLRVPLCWSALCYLITFSFSLPIILFLWVKKGQQHPSDLHKSGHLNFFHKMLIIMSFFVAIFGLHSLRAQRFCSGSLPPFHFPSTGW